MTCITEKSDFMGVKLFSSLFFHQTAYIATTTTTAWKSMFSFSRLPEKMVFPKQSRWNMIFLVLLGKMIFLFPENMILPPGGRWKIIFLQKKHTEIWYFLQTIWKDSLFENNHPGTWSFLYYHVFPENMVPFPCTENEGEITFPKK